MDNPNKMTRDTTIAESDSKELVPVVPNLELNQKKATFKPIDPNTFPDIVMRRDHIKVLETIPNFKHLLDSYGITLRFDVITNKTLFNIPDFEATPTNYDNKAVTQIISLMKLNGIGTNQTFAYISSVADSNPVNPVVDWIESKPWDGVDRLPDLYETLTVKPDFPVDFRNTLMRRWLISGAAAAYMPSEFHARGVLTPQGAQAIGKTSWLKSLVPDPLLQSKVVLLDHQLDVGNKDSILAASGSWLCELGELESSFKRDQARLKGYITASSDKVRAPYARVASEIPRKTIFYATVNDPQFLIDSTGNSRFWVLPVTKVDYEHGLDMQQVWAQVAHLFKVEKEQWWLSAEEERLLERLNRPHRAVSAIRDMVESRLNFDAQESDWRRLTASGLLRELGIESPSNFQAKEAAQVLREHFGDPKKSQGSMRWRVPPVMSSDWNPPEPETLNPLERIKYVQKRRNGDEPE